MTLKEVLQWLTEGDRIGTLGGVCVGCGAILLAALALDAVFLGGAVRVAVLELFALKYR